ncbi:hypothetical protein OKW38_000753 [Paraburkholderia sp. MM5496-R1]|uniref:hypothetical protein n=1 Tax=Paraburkholderia TaxID=1822464 RepID=UPI001428C9B9|nr:hypothetical protein [Paraburkholderia tuberum]
MFLSRVADPERCHALSGNAYDQRFNVAASRARGLDLLAMLRVDVVSAQGEIFEELIERLTSMGIEPLGREHRLT